MTSPESPTQSRARKLVVELRFGSELRLLPAAVRRFQWRARRRARRSGDAFSLGSSTRPRDLAVLLELAAEATTVGELGTATGWTAISLALASPARRVVSYDPTVHASREAYLALAPERVRDQIEFVAQPGASGPPPGLEVDLLYIDSSHSYEDTVGELAAWLPAMRPGGTVVFDDYEHPGYPGVRKAVEEAGLGGSLHGALFVHRLSASSTPRAA